MATPTNSNFSKAKALFEQKATAEGEIAANKNGKQGQDTLKNIKAKDTSGPRPHPVPAPRNLNNKGKVDEATKKSF